MKKILLYGLAIVAMNICLPGNTCDAKPDYCYQALLNCVRKCDTGVPLFTEGCTLGCEIGFLLCGKTLF